MRLFRLLAVTCALAALVLPTTGCSDVAETLPESAASDWTGKPGWIVEPAPGDEGLPKGNSSDPADGLRALHQMKAAAAIMGPSYGALRLDAGPNERAAALQDAFRADGIPDDSRRIAEVFVSLHAIDELIPVEGEKASPKNMEPFVNLLLEHKNPNADVVLRGIRHMEGYWSDEHVASASHQAAATAQAYLNRLCENCSAESMRRTNGPLLTAIASLEELAEASI